jgi:hypothetical protein
MIDDERGTLRLEFNRRMAFLHLMVRKPMAALRGWRDVFYSVKAILRAIGYSAVNVIIPEGDAKLYRFEIAFGFREIRRAGGHILMSQEC